MSAPHDAAENGRSHGTPATTTTLVISILSLAATAAHGVASADWTPLGIAAVSAWAVFLPALAYDVAQAERDAR